MKPSLLYSTMEAINKYKGYLGLHTVGKFIANELEADIHFVAIPHDVQSSTYTLVDNITMCSKSN